MRRRPQLPDRTLPGGRPGFRFSALGRGLNVPCSLRGCLSGEPAVARFKAPENRIARHAWEGGPGRHFDLCEPCVANVRAVWDADGDLTILDGMTFPCDLPSAEAWSCDGFRGPIRLEPPPPPTKRRLDPDTAERWVSGADLVEAD